jgi:hypothetical protein
VLTAPVAITIWRILLLRVSATYSLVPSVVMPVGLLNVAAVPVPSAAPAVTGTPDAPVTLLTTADARLSGAPCIAPPIRVVFAAACAAAGAAVPPPPPHAASNSAASTSALYNILLILKFILKSPCDTTSFIEILTQAHTGQAKLLLRWRY